MNRIDGKEKNDKFDFIKHLTNRFKRMIILDGRVT